MADSKEVFTGIDKYEGVSYSVLTPNMKGLEGALSVGAKEISVFGAASESFTKKNLNTTIEKSLDNFIEVVEAAKPHGLKI